MDIQTGLGAPESSFLGRAAGIGACCLALATFGCSSQNTPSIEAITSSQPVTAVTNNQEGHPSSFEVHKIDAHGFETAIADFINVHKNLRITAIEGDGNGLYGRDSRYALITRVAVAGEPSQSAEKLNFTDPVEAALAYRTANPDRKIDALVGDGNHLYGHNGFYVAVTSPRSPE